MEYFTIIFCGNIKKFLGNPFKTLTPFGYPVAIGSGDAFEELDRAREALKALEGDANGD